jgi:hypothetical protein
VRPAPAGSPYQRHIRRCCTRCMPAYPADLLHPPPGDPGDASSLDWRHCRPSSSQSPARPPARPRRSVCQLLGSPPACRPPSSFSATTHPQHASERVEQLLRQRVVSRYTARAVSRSTQLGVTAHARPAAQHDTLASTWARASTTCEFAVPSFDFGRWRRVCRKARGIEKAASDACLGPQADAKVSSGGVKRLSQVRALPS